MLFTGESNERGSWQSPCSTSTSKSFYIFVSESRFVFVLFFRIKKAAIHELLNKSLKKQLLAGPLTQLFTSHVQNECAVLHNGTATLLSLHMPSKLLISSSGRMGNYTFFSGGMHNSTFYYQDCEHFSASLFLQRDSSFLERCISRCCILAHHS